MNRADEVTPLTPFRAALKVRSRVASPSCDAGSSSAAVIRADASSIQSRPVEPRRLTPLPAFFSPPPTCFPMRRLALPLAANPPMRALGFASDNTIGLPARFLASATRLALAAPGLPFRSALSSCLAVFSSALYTATMARWGRVMTSRARPATWPTAYAPVAPAAIEALAVSSMAVCPMVSAMSVRSTPACAALDTVMVVARPSRSRRPVPRRTRMLSGCGATAWARAVAVVYRVGATPRKTLRPPAVPVRVVLRPYPPCRWYGLPVRAYAVCRAPVRVAGTRVRLPVIRYRFDVWSCRRIGVVAACDCVWTVYRRWRWDWPAPPYDARTGCRC